MTEFIPFKGLLYNPRKIKDFSDVLAPPYDVISNQKRDELYDKSDYGMIRLILGKDLENDSEEDNKYIRAREDLNDWIKQGIITKDDKDSFYIYHQEYEVGGKRFSRLGFMGLMKIQEQGEDSVLPHEYTLSKPKEDRMNLITKVESNLSPIFMLYDDSDNKINVILDETINKEQPVIDVDIDGVIHKLWRLSDEKKLIFISEALRGRTTFIADGHHRFEVARRYREMRKEDPTYDGSADFVMVYLTDMSQPDNLKIFPTHRVIKKISLDEDQVNEKLGEYFSFDEVETLADLKEKLESMSGKLSVFGLFFKKKYYILEPKDNEDLISLIKEDRSENWKKLDVSVLQYAVFNNILQMKEIEGNVTFVKTFEEAEKLVNEGSHDMAFFLNSTRVDQLKAVAELGEMMPQKSTYFYPKLLSGLVINKFENIKATV